MDLILRVGADIDKFRSELNKVQGSFNGFNSSLKTLGAGIAAAFTFDALKNFTKEMINVTAEFQKFEAVLTNTLGSNSAAQLSLGMIQEFASVTPYSVQELTDSFVRLANQGFKPTRRELTNLGDLASAMGKSFNQLTEAIIDAQTGEFERLKEFGIRASKAGDQVTFSFKGVETQTEFTAQAIRDYILSLGELEGVSGGMAAISETLGGKISNLGDSYDRLLNTVGQGGLGAAFQLKLMELQTMLDSATAILMTEKQIDQARVNKIAGSLVNSVQESIEKLSYEEKINKIREKRVQLEKQLKANQINMSEAERYSKGLEENVKNGQKNLRIQNQAIEVAKKELYTLEQSLHSEKKATEEKNKQLAAARLMEEVEARLDRFRQRARLVDGRVQKFEDTKIGKVDTSGLTNMANTFEAINARIQPVVLSMQTSLQSLQNYVMVDFAPAIANSFLNLGIGIGEAFGNMASGIGGFEQLASAALGALGAMLGQFGQLAIQAGLTKIALDKALVTFGGGGLAVAAGIALVALSKMVSNKAASIARGGGSGGGSVSGRGASALEGRSVDYAPGQRIVIGGEFKVDGKNLVAAINNQSRFDGRTKS